MLREHNRATDLIPDKDTFKNSLATLPLVTYQPGKTVIAYGSRTGRGLLRGGCLLMALSGHLNASPQAAAVDA
jgi:hypothetical protein